MINCENCGKEHDGSYGSGRFCSNKCARGFSTKLNRKNISKSVSEVFTNRSKPKIDKICDTCGRHFQVRWDKSNQLYCSRSCSSSNIKRKWTDEAKSKFSNIVKDSYANGRIPVTGGKVRHFNYGNILVHGSLEHRTCRILDEWKSLKLIHDWEYTKDRFKYLSDKGDIRTYFMDFKVITNDKSFFYLEVKGFKTSNDECKWKKVRESYRLDVWYRKDIIILEKELNLKYQNDTHDWVKTI
jgi:hypothetical protein